VNLLNLVVSRHRLDILFFMWSRAGRFMILNTINNMLYTNLVNLLNLVVSRHRLDILFFDLFII